MAATLGRDDNGNLIRKAGVMAVVLKLAARFGRTTRSASKFQPSRTLRSIRSSDEHHRNTSADEGTMP